LACSRPKGHGRRAARCGPHRLAARPGPCLSVRFYGGLRRQDRSLRNKIDFAASSRIASIPSINPVWDWILPRRLGVRLYSTWLRPDCESFSGRLLFPTVAARVREITMAILLWLRGGRPRPRVVGTLEPNGPSRHSGYTRLDRSRGRGLGQSCGCAPRPGCAVGRDGSRVGRGQACMSRRNPSGQSGRLETSGTSRACDLPLSTGRSSAQRALSRPAPSVQRGLRARPGSGKCRHGA
jgi:hypothetical protein